LARDRLAVEGPLEIRAGSERTVVMRTPGHDLELTRGLLFGEGVLRSREEAATVQRPPAASLAAEERENVVEVALDGALLAERWPPRSLYASSACGVCGRSSVDALDGRASPVRSDLTVPAGLIAALPERLRAAQDVFAATGGLHAAGAFDAAGE